MRVVARHNTGQSGPRNRAPRSHGYSKHNRNHNRGFSSRGAYNNGVYHHTDARGFCKCCTCLCIFVPVVLLIAGIITLSIKNTRIERIIEYNTKVTTWNTRYSDTFEKTSFSFGSQENVMSKREKSGTYYPHADNCNAKNDPEGGCVSTKSHFYETTVNTSGDSVSINIFNSEGKSIYSKEADTGYFIIYTKGDMNCRSNVADSDSESCYRKCVDKNGEYDDWSATCKVAYSLIGYCLRVIESDSSFKADDVSSSTFPSMGCYASSGFNPLRYEKQWKIPPQINVEIRHHHDPVIYASLCTFGCSDGYLNNSKNGNCFGLSQSGQKTIGIMLIFISLVIIFVLVAIIISTLTCIKSLCGKVSDGSDHGILSSPQGPVIPIALPVDPMAYAQSASYGQDSSYVQAIPYGQAVTQPNPNGQPSYNMGQYAPPGYNAGYEQNRQYSGYP